MGSPGGTENFNVIRAARRQTAWVEGNLRQDACHFQFFQAVRLLERIGLGREPVGQFAGPEKEAVRFSTHNALAFPASQIQKIDWPEEQQPQMAVNFMGLTGTMGALPHAYTELILERIRAKDPTVAEFFDIFNHRIISLFYQAWEKYHLAVAYERDQDDPVSNHLLALIGMGTGGLRDRQPFPDQALVYYSGLLSLHPRSAVALAQILEDYFEVPVEIEQFVGAWYALDVKNQCCFDAGDSDSEKLGFGAVVGDEIWDQQSRARIRLGPLSTERYLDFLPNGKSYKPLQALTRFFSGGDLEYEVQLVLKQKEVPQCELGAEGAEAPRLGWFTWMKSAPAFDRNPGDTILLLN
jgi:type VI secretion system protein ImpH